MATVALLLYLLFLALAVERAKASHRGGDAPSTGQSSHQTTSSESARPVSASRRVGRFTVPAWWLLGALCVHQHESRDWHIINPPYSGGMQFTTYTWQSVGGQGIAAWASPAEQLYRAWLVWRRDGGSWREWPNTSRMCGLR